MTRYITLEREVEYYDDLYTLVATFSVDRHDGTVLEALEIFNEHGNAPPTVVGQNIEAMYSETISQLAEVATEEYYA
jgi:hypothetical protein